MTTWRYVVRVLIDTGVHCELDRADSTEKNDGSSGQLSRFRGEKRASGKSVLYSVQWISLINLVAGDYIYGLHDTLIKCHYHSRANIFISCARDVEEFFTIKNKK